VLSSVQVSWVKFLTSHLIFSVHATRQLTCHHSLEYSVEYCPNRVTVTNCLCFIYDVVMNMVIIIRMMIIILVIIGATGTVSESFRK